MTSVRNRKQLAVKFGCVLFLGLIIFGGCKKKTEPVSVASPAPAQTAVVEQPAAPSAEQTVCPVMGGPVNKDIFVEYKGKKVYFCCPSCIDEFEKDPEKYISKLPQFN